MDRVVPPCPEEKNTVYIYSPLAARGNATTCPLAWEDMMSVHLFIERHYECHSPGANSKMWGDHMIF